MAEEGKDARILYVVVLFRQKLEECNAWRTLLKEERDVYVQDNSPEPMAHQARLPEGWRYVHRPDNPGLSAAYNSAAGYAREAGIEWLMLVDQDTRFPVGMGSRQRRLPAEFPGVGMFVPRVRIMDGRYMSPVKKRHYFTRPATVPLQGSVRLDDTAVINSGLMVSTDRFLECGGYNENVFLDFSDFQFVDRFSAVCPEAVVTREECLQAFSACDDKGERQMSRFGRFCMSAGSFRPRRRMERIMVKLVILKRALSLALGSRSLRPFGIMARSIKKRVD